MKPQHWGWGIVCTMVLACSHDDGDRKGDGSSTTDSDLDGTTGAGSGDDASDEDDAPASLEIVPGVGIGPVHLGDRYGDLYEAYGEPDVITDYNRLFLATWLELGVEIVVGSGRDDAPEADSIVASVGTRLPDGFHGVVFPGMSRVDADDALGPCLDVIDDQHCFHTAGVYLLYTEDGLIERVAVHSAYTLRPEPPQMLPALGLGGSP